MYLISLGAGILAGLLYGLIGLLGMLVGEQIVPAAKRMIDG